MTVRYRIIIALFTILVCAGFGMHLLVSRSMLDGITELEQSRADADLKRVDRSLAQIIEYLHGKSRDWSNWDDSYEFMAHPTDAYIKSNLSPNSLSSINLDAVLYVTPARQLFCGQQSKRLDLATEPTPKQILRELNDSAAFGTYSAGLKESSGLVWVNGRAVIVSIRQITDSSGTKPPRGWIVFCQYFSDRTVDELRSLTKQDVDATFVHGALIIQGRGTVLSSLAKKRTDLRIINNAKMVGYTVWMDLRGNHIVLLRTNFDRGMHAYGQVMIESMNWQLFGLSLFIGCMIVWMVERFALSRLQALAQQVGAIDMNSQSMRIHVGGKDEFGRLATQINHMLTKLEVGASRLRESEEALRVHNESLEQIVEQRTQQIEYQAYHDKLTGLPNRTLFMNRMEHALVRAGKSGLGTATIFIDLDNFKLVNDSLGHAMGDALLIEIAQRLNRSVRPGDLVARLGGDEFTVVMEDLEDPTEAEFVAQRILAELKDPVWLGGQETFPGGSLGIAYCAGGELSAQDLVKNADTAMYHAKASGKSTYVLFNTTMEDHAIERLEIETALRKAVAAGEITPYYQPLIDLRSGEIIGAEALARWNHPARGPVSPALFIPIAEETGLIAPIGYGILEMACMQAVYWQYYYGLTDFTMSVNLSGRQLQRDDVVQRVRDIIHRTRIAPQNLKLEITESILMENRADIVEKMAQLKEMGVKLALDDFGTGYSSLSTLRSFPIDTLKIDRSFICRLDEDSGATAIVEAIMALAKTMRLDVTGEGVESESQAKRILELGCSTGQGYLFDKPLSAEAFESRFGEMVRQAA